MKKFIRLLSIIVSVCLIASAMPAFAADAVEPELADAKRKLVFSTLSAEPISGVTTDFQLPVVWETDCFIVWKSESPEILEIEGNGATLSCKVTRPAFGEGDSVGILQATIIRNDEFVTKNFAVTVKELEIGYAYSATIVNAYEQFDFELLSLQNIFGLRSNLIIPENSVDGVKIDILSDREDVLTSGGVITRSSSNDEKACFTVTFTYGNEILRRSYPVIVKALGNGDVESMLDDDLAVAINNILQSCNVNAITSNISLPVSGTNGSTFTWSTSDADVVTSTGSITQGSINKTATLTVTAQLQGIVKTNTITVTVIAQNVPGGEYEGSGGGTGAMRPVTSGGGGGGGFTPSVPTKPTGSFPDVPEEHWAFDAIEKLKELEIVSGNELGNFEPDASVTREQAVKMLIEAFDAVDQNPSEPFEDVADGAWYTDYIATAYSAGIVNGISDTLFGTGNFVTRQDFAVMLYKTLQYCGWDIFEAEDVTFTDAADIAPYAKKAINDLVGKGVLTGMPDGTFCPQQEMTRAQVAMTLYRLLAG